MSYQVLARKWRPRNFAELVGQEHVLRPLVNALDHGRLHHAFLFTGTRGVGKTTIARILAKSLNCETGVKSQPCGECSACVEVTEGRFVDLIEVDAASRTKVDETRELLDNVQYAPTRGRYKVYLIDEVHMLSTHSFNALLKTLEEPPPHVKFLLATTDPQKLPVTVLSRCLQFNLKRLMPEQIEGQLQRIVAAEDIAHDTGSLKLLARAADGSMRDALSLLDQAIAYSGGGVNEAEVRKMLGTIDQDAVDRLLAGLVAGDVHALMAVVADVTEHGANHDALLAELLLALHRIALAHGGAGARDEAAERLQRYVQLITPEDVQLYYQIGVLARRDLAYAPDSRTAVEMALLRMLAFRPEAAGALASAGEPMRTNTAVPRTPTQSLQPAPLPKRAASRLTEVALTPDGWSGLVGRLALSGMARELANNTVLESVDGATVNLILDTGCAQLLGKEREAALKQALEQALNRELRLNVRVGKPEQETPAKERLRTQAERQQAAEEAIAADPTVQALKEKFNARVSPGSVRPKV